MPREQYEEQKRRQPSPRLPELLAVSDVYRALGDDPDRGSPYRILQELKDLGSIPLPSRDTGHNH